MQQGVREPGDKVAQPAQGPRHVRQVSAPFEGDVSEWGRTQLEDFYDSEVEPEVSELSSGISPRDLQPRLRPFDMDAATQALAYQSGMFSRAQALRRDGCAPAAMGIPDDLPIRMAYQQLNMLAGMAGKVQDAILHNKRIFEQRMLAEGKALQRRVLHGWHVVLERAVAKRARLARAQGRLQRGLLLRVFFSWKDELHHADKTLAMKRKVAAVTGAGCVRRCFQCWLALARERWWKTQLSSMEVQVGLLEAKLRGYEKRPIQVLRKRRLSQLLSAWLVEALWCQHKRHQQARAACLCRRHRQQRAWSTWCARVVVKVRQRVLTQKLVRSCQHFKQQAAWDAWLQAIECQHSTRGQLTTAAQHYQHAARLKAWRAWQSRAKQHRSSRVIANRWKRLCMARAFKFWLWYASKQKRQRVVLARTLAKRRQLLVVKAFECWLDYLEHKKLKRQMGEEEAFQVKLQELQNENARLRRDNERFVRLIDSGEWGRGRVEELTAAGELMRAERDALLKLVQALRREYEAVQLAKEAQHDELRTLKDKMTVKGAARNCLLVKGGSSFNALVRALKQDLIDSGTAAKDPALLYQIDKLSMDRVQVYPDGELNIQAVTSGPQGSRITQQHRASQPSSLSYPRAQSPRHQHLNSSSSPRGWTPTSLDVAGPGLNSGLQDTYPNLRVAVGAYGSLPGSSSGSPTHLGTGTGAGSFFSPKAGALGSSPLRQAGQPALTAAAAAAAAAVAGGLHSPVGRHTTTSVNVSPVKGANLGMGASAGGYSPTKGRLQQQKAAAGLGSTDSMLQALSSLSPAQVQRLAVAAGQQHAGEQRLLSTAPASLSSHAPAARSAGPARPSSRPLTKRN